mmetsp:Transcript_16785/g.27835  ORF Transcript_16785/g.27835 Transcript_16785/m.27835 type:complete len:144 (-) Transcript_16785:580-1011(-)
MYQRSVRDQLLVIPSSLASERMRATSSAGVKRESPRFGSLDTTDPLTGGARPGYKRPPRVIASSSDAAHSTLPSSCANSFRNLVAVSTAARQAGLSFARELATSNPSARALSTSPQCGGPSPTVARIALSVIREACSQRIAAL